MSELLGKRQKLLEVLSTI